MDPLADSTSTTDIGAELKSINRELNKLRRQGDAQRTASLLTDIHDAYKSRRMADMHRYCRMLAGRGKGPGKRRYHKMLSVRPTKADWMELLQKPGKEGGMGAVEASPDEAIRDAFVDAPLPLPTRDTAASAKQDLRDTVAALMKAPKRRTAPPWSVPLELFLMGLRPDYYSVGKPKTEGIGFQAPGKHARDFADRVPAVHGHVRRSFLTLRIAHKTMGVSLDKENNKPGVLALRLIHVLCTYWRTHFRALLLRSTQARPPDYRPSTTAASGTDGASRRWSCNDARQRGSELPGSSTSTASTT